MTRVIGALLAFMFSGCSTFVDVPLRGIRTICHARECPSGADTEAILGMFGEEVPGFDPGDALDVGWYPFEYVFLEWDESRSVGHTVIDRDNPEEPILVEVTSERVLIHELMHVHLYRTTGDSEPVHEQGNGPWTEDTNATIERIITNNNL